MLKTLSLTTVVDYLIDRRICTEVEADNPEIEPLVAKNFNLLVKLNSGDRLLVKQERRDRQGKTAGEFEREWRVQQLLQQFPQLESLRPYLPVMLYFDAPNSIVIFRYLDKYQDLSDFYLQANFFPSQIAAAIGQVLATIHRSTFNCPDYCRFLTADVDPHPTQRLIRSLKRISPEIFGEVPSSGLKFFALYQRYDSLGQAIAELGKASSACCLTHNDFKLNNILLHRDWQTLPDSEIVRPIDWERASWGDPAFDLGTLLAGYLQIWLSSLVISQALSIEESLRLAATPLEHLQPSMAAAARAYWQTFPEIWHHRPDFWQRAVQFAGLALIQQIQASIQYEKSFGNLGICTLQVAKSLLCRPETSMPTIFGSAAFELQAC